MPRSKKQNPNAEHATLLRQWAMFMAIPRGPQKRSVQEIHSRLADDGHEINLRTIQRDLNRFSLIFGYTCEINGRTQLWYFPRECLGTSVPEMSAATALAMHIANEQSRGLIPPATLNLLRPYFSKAEDVLDGQSRSGLGRWRDRVRVIRPGPILRLPEVDEPVLQAVYDGLFGGRQIRVHYRNRESAESGEAVEQHLHPLGLVAKRGLLYLVACAWDYQKPLHYALHRMVSAETLDDLIREPPGFSFDQYTRQTFDYPHGVHPLRLRLRMSADGARHLAECPLSADQKIVKTDDSSTVEIRATVEDTEELRWWLQAYGAEVEVLGPAVLRRRMADTVRTLADKYLLHA